MRSLDDLLMALLEHAEALPLQGWLNLVFAVAGALVAFGAIVRMSSETERPIIFAFITVGSGLIGQGLTNFLPDQWELSFDTLLYGGILALLVGTRRQTIALKPKWMPVISLCTSGATWCIFLGAMR